MAEEDKKSARTEEWLPVAMRGSPGAPAVPDSDEGWPVPESPDTGPEHVEEPAQPPAVVDESPSGPEADTGASEILKRLEEQAGRVGPLKEQLDSLRAGLDQILGAFDRERTVNEESMKALSEEVGARTSEGRELFGSVDARVQGVEAALRRLDEELTEVDESYSRRLTQIEAKIDAGVTERVAAIEWRLDEIARPRSVTAPSLPVPPRLDPDSGSESADGMVDLNGASFEALRGIGLSVTQAARVISIRELREGFSSLDELALVPGLPPTLREDLRERLTV